MSTTIAAIAVSAIAVLILSPLFFLMREKPQDVGNAPSQPAETAPGIQSAPKSGGGLWTTLFALVIGATVSALVRMGFMKHDFLPLVIAAGILFVGIALWIMAPHRKRIAAAAGEGAISTIAAGVKTKRRLDAIKADVSARVDKKLHDDKSS